MINYTELLNERHKQEDRLKSLGFDVDGGGVDMSGFWEIFVYLHPTPTEEVCIILSSVGDVDQFIRDHPSRSDRN